jgi:hypothetical protein
MEEVSRRQSMIRKAIVALVLIMAVGAIGTATFIQSTTPVYAQDTGPQGKGKKKGQKQTPIPPSHEGCEYGQHGQNV